jgi:hypothetical protein
MEWVKIKSEHISPEYTDAQVGALVRFQLLVARLKRMPTDKELFKEITKKNWTSLVLGLSSFGVGPELVCSKVLEDVEFVEKNRQLSRETSRRNRLKTNRIEDKGDTSRDVSHQVSRDVSRDRHVTKTVYKRREEKEHKSIKKKDFTYSDKTPPPLKKAGICLRTQVPKKLQGRARAMPRANPRPSKKLS